MNTKQYFGSNKKFLFGNLLNIVVIFSMILTSCGSPKEQAAEEQGAQFFGKGLKWNHYEPPVYTHPEPVVGERPTDDGQIIHSSTEKDIPSIMFVENIGQFEEEARFQANSEQGTIFLADDAVWITLLEDASIASGVISEDLSGPLTPESDTPQISPTPTPAYEENATSGVNLRFSFVGANRNSKVEGFDPLDSSISYFSGNDSHSWKADAPAWAGVRYVDFYPGYNLELTSKADTLYWRFVLNATSSIESKASVLKMAAPAKFAYENEIRLRIEGADSLALNGNQVEISTMVGSISLPLPELAISPLDSRPESDTTLLKPILDGDEIILPFQLPKLDTKPTNLRSPAFIDTSISYARADVDTVIRDVRANRLVAASSRSNLGASVPVNISMSNAVKYSRYMSGSVHDIVLDNNGSVYIVGNASSASFPTTPGAFHSPGSNTDIFVSKLSSDGFLEFSALIGGNAVDNGNGIAVDGMQNIYITGNTSSTNLPVTSGAYDTTNSGSIAFVIKLNPAGTNIVYGTYLGIGEAAGFDIAVNSNGEAYVVGQTPSASFPTTVGAYDRINNGWDGFVTRFNSTGSSLIFSTYLGGTSVDCEISSGNQECSITLDSSGAVYITGHTLSSDFPTTVGAYDRIFDTNGSNFEMFVTKLQPNGNALIYSTFLGGSGNDRCEPKCDLDVDKDGYAYIVGTSSGNFPTTTSAYNQSYNGGASDIIIVKLTQNGGGLVYSTYLGTSDTDAGHDITVENGIAMVTGETTSPNFPLTTNAFQGTFGGIQDSIVTFLNANGDGLKYSTYIGGSSYEIGWGISSSPNGDIAATGVTGSGNLPGTSGTPANSYITNFNFATSIIYDPSVISNCANDCQPAVSATGFRLAPINTRTGGLFYQTEDISVPTAAEELNFFRTYSSLSTDLYSSTLGYGWAHNLDTRLIFPSDPGGEVGYVLLKAHTANQYQFVDHGGGTYSPAAGVVGSLVQNNGQYIFTHPNQNEYTFDSTGRLLSRADAEGHAWDYSYAASGLLELVTADGGSRHLQLAYDAQGRIVSVEDQTGRSISYTYDGNGDLVSATNLGGGTWQYEYDSTHHLTRVIDPLGNTDERTEYDAQGRAIKQWDGLGNLTGELTYNPDGSTTITDSLGNVETHTYDDRRTLIGDTDPLGGATNKTYDNNFRPLTITDADGATTNLAWSGDGANLLEVKDALGNQTSITYDPLNNPVTVVGPAPYNYKTTYGYDGNLLTSVMDATQGETTYTYTPEGHLESVTDGEGVTTTYGYDSHGQRISMTDELQNTWEYAYDDLGRLVDQIDPLERVTHNEYDAAGRLVRVTRNYDPNRPQNADNEWNIITEYEYDFVGYQTLVRDTLGRETQYEYDAAGRLIKTIDPELHEMISEYDEAGRLSVTIDALQHYTYYFYDEAGRLKETKNELDGIASTAYNLDGTVASTTDEMSRTTYYTYDDLKRVTVVTQPGGGQTKNTYDEPGNLVKVEDPLGNITQYVYDAVGRQIKTIDPDLNETESFYDDAGRLIQTVDARENHTTYEYDETGRLEKVIDQLGGTTTYEYDEAGRRSAVIDANLNRTEYTYDRLDRVLAVTNPSGTVYTEYDAAGQVLSRTDANGNPAEFTYTALGQLETQKDAAGGTTTYGYDVLGNRISVQDANLHTTFMEYDELNRLVRVIDPALNETRTVYDAAGQVVTTFDALNQPTNYEYNELGLQIKVKDPLEHEVQYSYNAAGQMTGMLDANSIATAYEYDPLGRLKAVIENYQAAVQPTTQINVRTEYTYDENGNRRTIKDGNGHITNFTYDELNRLINESDPLDNSWSYGYDALGNRLSMTDANGITTDYAYDDANRLEGVDSAGTDADVSFEYDAGGRRIGMTDAIGTTTWNYDDLNRPIGITDPFEKTVGYAYDAVGNRLSTTYSGREVNYGYDPANRLTQVSDQASNTNYQYDPLGRIANILRPNGVNSTYTYDAAGRLIQLQHGTPESQLASYQYTYDAAGNRIQAVEHLKTARTSPTVRLTVVDSSGSLLGGKEVYAFNGDTYTGYHKTTDAGGQVAITLPQGDYRFRVDVDGTQFWSANENHCTIGQCTDLLVTIPTPVLIVVADSDGNLRAGIPVSAFIADPSTPSTGQVYAGYQGVTNAEGALMLRLPAGDYRFRADLNGTQFWSEDTCSVPGCGIIPITVTLPVTVTVLDNTGMSHAGVEVYAFNGTTYTNQHATTDENGQAQFTLPNGEYRFRADFNGTQFWSGPSPSSGENHCTVPDCWEAGVAVTLPLIVTVTGTDGSPQQGILVYAFDGTTYSGFNGTTDADGRVTFTLPAGNYRFRADFNGTQFWSGTQNHCSVPDCSGAQVSVTSSTTITVTDTENTPKAGVAVYAFNGTTYTSYHGTTNANGQVSLTLPQGSYRFRADYNGTQFWSGGSNHCDIPGCSSASVTVTNSLLVTVQDTDGTPKAGLKVYAFNGVTYTGFNATTNANGQVTFTLPQGSYRFRADLNGTQFWSGAANHCTLPGCAAADVTITIPLTVTVQIADGTPQLGIKVYAFNGTTYTGYNITTNADGLANFTLPQGSYRFRADYNGTQYWSSTSNHCVVPGCLSLTVIVGPQAAATPTPTHTATPLPTPTPTETETPTPTPTATATETPTPMPSPTGTEAPIGRLPGNVFAISYAQPKLIPVNAEAAPARYDSLTVDEFDSTLLDPAWTWDEPLAGPSWSLTNNPGFFQFTVPPGYEHWEGINTAPSLRRSDMGTDDFAIETSFDFATDTPGDGYQYGLMIGFSETDRLWLGVFGGGQVRINRTDGEDYSTWVSTSMPVFLRIEKVGPMYTFSYKQNSEDDWTTISGYESSNEAVTYVGMFGRTFAADSDVTYNVDYFRLERTDMPTLLPPGSGVGLVGKYFDNSMDIDGTPLHTQLDPQVNFEWGEDSPADGVPPDFSARWKGQLEARSSEEYIFEIYAGDEVRLWIDGQLYIDNWDAPGQYWLYTPAISLVSGQKYDIQIDFRDTGGAASVTWSWRTVSSSNINWEPVPMQQLYPLAELLPPGSGVGLLGKYFDNSTNINGAPLHTQLDPQVNFEWGADSPADGVPLDFTARWKGQLEARSSEEYMFAIFADDETRLWIDGQLYIDTWNNPGQDWLYTPAISLAGGQKYDIQIDFRDTGDGAGIHFQWRTLSSNIDWETVPMQQLYPPADDDGTTVSVVNADDVPQEGLNVFVFDNTTYTGFSGVTDVYGQAAFTLPDGSYRFRADLNGTHFWSGDVNHCEAPVCEDGVIIVSDPVTVTVLDTDSTPKEGLNVYAFDNETYTGYHLATDANGQAIFTLPFGIYRFRADLNGTQFWSGTENHCDLNDDCESATITVTKPVIVEVKDQDDTPYAELSVYAFDGETYTGYNGTTAANGKVTLTLPQGNYRFRADYEGVQFWSNPSAGSGENTCAIPGCESATISLPGGPEQFDATINYTYDPLYRLVDANYSSGDRYQYTYDSVGNRLTQDSSVPGLSSFVSYNYDIANRLTEVEGVPYVYDANGNLLNDGTNDYAYDSANRLISVSGQSTVSSYQYSGLGDRLSQTVDGQVTNYTLDLNAGLTQVLDDGTTSYTYGLGRISQQSGSTTDYFLGDALGSVRQLTSQSGQVTYAKSYDPYGVVTQVSGEGQSAYGYTGEQQSNDIVYLRARYYSPLEGRFLSRDTWEGDGNNPMSYNLWNYVQSNPINYTDSTGHDRCGYDEYNYINRADFAERYVDRTALGYPIRDYLNTYTAAGIGVQCFGTNLNKDYWNSGWGPAQISNNQRNTAYGEEAGNDNGDGLRCWISNMYKYILLRNGVIIGDVPLCSICKTDDEMKAMDKDYKQHYQLEPPHNPNEPTWAVEYMRRRIKLVTDACENKGCSSTDIYIAAALAQNGPGFTQLNIIKDLKKQPANEKSIRLDWFDYFGLDGNADDTSRHLIFFTGVIKELEKRSWYLPYVNWNTVDELSKIAD